MNDHKKLFDLRHRVALIVGGTGGIGSEMAAALAAFGAKVAVSGRSEQAASSAAGEIEKTGGKAIGIALDVTNAESVMRGVAAAEERLGPIDILLNCAGTQIEQPAEEATLEAWDTVLDTNLRGAFVLSQAVAKSMIARARAGSHIHITSVRSTLGIRRGYAAYCAGKGGLGILIKQLATEWAPHGIRVNGIAPTFTRTPLVEQYLNDPAFYGALVNRIPLGRVCETRDLAGIAVFLASDASSFITGQNIFVDGGITASQ